jgi:hypothetical protein
MKTKSNVVAVVAIIIVTLSIIVVSTVMIRLALGGLRHTWNALDDQAGIILALASVVVLLSTSLIASAIRSTKAQRVKIRTAAKRQELYENVLETLSPFLQRRSGEPLLTHTSLLLRASTPVLKEYRSLLTLLSNTHVEPQEVYRQGTRLLLAMRRDCGLSNYGLETEEWSTFFRDCLAVPCEPNDFSIPTGIGIRARVTHGL